MLHNSSKIGKTILVASVLCYALAAHAEKPFKVCADPNNPPLTQKDGDGYGNRIAELFAKELGQKVEYTWFPQRLGFIRNTLKMKMEDSEEFLCDVVMEVPQGFELTATTRPYYHSTYALVFNKDGPLGGIKSASDIDSLAPEVKSKLRIAMFDGGAPGTSWIVKHGLVGQGIPYQVMTGDASQNTAMVLANDFKEKKLDMAIIWGPMAGYVVKQRQGQLRAIPMQSEPDIKFDFAMSMGVRVPDKERKELLNGLIEKNASEIEAILKSYEIPLLPIMSETPGKKKD
jgi:mxaJ protein